MSSPGYTKNPCHGCGKVVDHKKDELCGDCKILIQHGKDFLEFKEISLSNKENVLVRTPNVFSTYSHKTFYSNITESNSVLGKILNDKLKNGNYYV